MLYLVRGLLNMVQDYTWEDNSDAKVRVYTSALPLLAAMSQESYLYSIPKSNSAHTHKFCMQQNKILEVISFFHFLSGLQRDALWRGPKVPLRNQ